MLHQAWRELHGVWVKRARIVRARRLTPHAPERNLSPALREHDAQDHQGETYGYRSRARQANAPRSAER
jgi:hypothetical protein